MNPQQMMGVLSDPTRFAVLNRLIDAGPASASALADQMPVSRQAVSKHLAALEDAGLLTRSRRGKAIEYVFDPAPLGDLVTWVNDVGSQWDARLGRLRDQLG